jgi:hypothetical protein
MFKSVELTILSTMNEELTGEQLVKRMGREKAIRKLVARHRWAYISLPMGASGPEVICGMPTLIICEECSTVVTNPRIDGMQDIESALNEHAEDHHAGE